jgi:thiamine kinase-like enzyme
MECIDGTTLDETTIHNSNSKPLLQTIALQLRTLHSIPFKVEPNMLWYSLEAMLENTWSEELLQEYRFLHSHISPLPLHMCLGHGDFKPSNIVLHYDGLVRFIDFELSGLHYRGFDIAKLFRTDSVVNTDNRDFFINIYSDENSDLTEALQLEAAILEPMTVSR